MRGDIDGRDGLDALDVPNTTSLPQTYTVAIFDGPLPVNARVLITCTHPRVVMETADLCMEQARMESLGMPDTERSAAMLALEDVRRTQGVLLAQLGRVGVQV